MSKVLEDNKLWIDETWSKIDKKFSQVTIRSRYKLPYGTVDGVHDDCSVRNINGWTNGFWGALNWLLYVGTGNEEYKTTALCSEKIMDKALGNYKELFHDVGFMWHILAGANYRLTGDMTACNKNLFAAASLFSRYNVDGGYIRAWNEKFAETWTIIDCMMNLPLLYWADKEIGDDRFSKIAIRHADMTLRDHVREDGSVIHIVEHDKLTGEKVKVHAGQGYSDTSCWSRGQAWAVYGMVLSYIHTKKERYLEAAIQTADYFISHCEKTAYLPVIDFMAPEKPVYYDSTAGVCTACGLLELAKIVEDNEAEKYREAAIRILKAIDTEFCDYSEQTDSIVTMGSARYPRNEEELQIIHVPIIYGDFFFVEALLKLKEVDFLIW